MLGTSARLLRLLTLLQTRRSWRGEELAERLAVTARTLRRDVEKLRTLGYPVDATSGVAGGYRLGAGASLPPLLLEDDEALAVSLALGTAASGAAIAGVEEAALRALAKLHPLLPAKLRKRAASLQATIAHLPHEGPTIEPRVLVAVAAACRDNERLAFGYRKRDGEAGPREVEPAGLVHVARRWYLVAWDLARADFRTFRLDRMAAPITAGARFSPRPAPARDLAAYVSRALSSDAYGHRARVLVQASRAQVVAKFGPLSASVEPVDAGSCLVTTGANTLEGLAAWVAMLGFEFTVLDPPALVDTLHALSARVRRAAEGSARAALRPRKRTRARGSRPAARAAR